LTQSSQYQKNILSHIESISNSGKPVVIFGAGRAGWYIMRVLEHHNVPIACFCDNDPSKLNTYCNYNVFSPQDIANDYPNAYIFIGVFVPGTAIEAQNQFQQIGLNDAYYDSAAFLFMFFIEVAGRICDNSRLARSIAILFENFKEGVNHYGLTKDNYFISPFVTSVITQRCSLKCRDCAQLIPYYKTPRNMTTESIIHDLRQYSKAFDVVPEISLHGGEPFLHPDIGKICQEVAAIPNIVFISFVTNGTILLSDETLSQLSSCGADVHQSGGYGSLSKKQAKLTEALNRNDVYSDILFTSSDEMWGRAPQYRPHFRPGIENDKLFQQCVSTKMCCQIMNGELHRCPLSMHGIHQGLFEKCEDDFVRLNESDNVLTGKIRALLTRDRALSVCDYCDPHGSIPVPPAVQL